jgi:hypothetical protein
MPFILALFEFFETAMLFTGNVADKLSFTFSNQGSRRELVAKRINYKKLLFQ